MAARVWGVWRGGTRQFSVEVNGDNELLMTMARLTLASPTAAAQALFAEAEVELEEMRHRTPVLSGALYQSGRVHPPEQTGDGIEVLMTFGEGIEPYAAAQHEKYWYEHTTGGPRYVTSVIEESQAFLLQRVAQRFMAGLKRNV